MNDYDNRKEEIIKKLERKFNKAGIPGVWAHNAARRVVEMWENSDRSKESFEIGV